MRRLQRLVAVCGKALLHAFDRHVAQIAAFAPAEQVVQDAHAQRAVGRPHLSDAKCLEHRGQNRSAAGDDLLPVGFEAREPDALDFAGRDQCLAQFEQAFGGDGAVAPTFGSKNVGHRAHRPARAERIVPVRE